MPHNPGRILLRGVRAATRASMGQHIQVFRWVALGILLIPIAAGAGTRELSRSTSCSGCVFTICTGASGFYELCADPCAAELVVRTPVNEPDPRPRTLIARGKKRTRLLCGVRPDTPCPSCEADADCPDFGGLYRPLCVDRTCRLLCGSGVVLELQ